MNKYKNLNIEIDGKKINPELLEIILTRIEAMPSNIKLAVLGSIFTREEIIQQIISGSKVGKEILEIEIGYYKDLIRD